MITKSYISKARTPKSGILAEILCSTSIDIDNFIIPLKCDSTRFSEFPVKILEFDGIDFSQNIGAGLKDLVNELQEANVETDDVPKNVLKEWFDAQKISTKIINRKEEYYSSWFKVILPKYIYVHYPVEDYSELGELIPHTFIRNGDYFISFFSSHNLNFESSFSQ